MGHAEGSLESISKIYSLANIISQNPDLQGNCVRDGTVFDPHVIPNYRTFMQWKPVCEYTLHSANLQGNMHDGDGGIFSISMYPL